MRLPHTIEGCGLRIGDLTGERCGVSPTDGNSGEFSSLRATWDMVRTATFATMQTTPSLPNHGWDQYHFEMIRSRAAALKENVSLT